jgi:hypothetical protein
MIEIRNERPKNREHFARLLEFCKEVVAVAEKYKFLCSVKENLDQENARAR